MKLKGKGFILRHVKLGDLKEYYKTETDKISKKMFMSFPKNIEEAKKDIQKHIKDNKKKPITSETFSIIKNRKYAGYVKIQFQNFNPKSNEGRIHVTIHPDFRGKGLATKAIKAITEYGFKKYKFERIFAQCKYTNKAVAKVNKKAGFRLEKIHTVEGIKKMWWVLEKNNIKAIIINFSQIIGTSDKAHAYFKKLFHPTKKQMKKANNYLALAKKGSLSKNELLSKMAKKFNVTKKYMQKEYEIGGKLLETNRANMKIIDKLRKKYKLVFVATSTALYSSLSVEKTLHKKYPVILTYKSKALVGTRKINRIALNKLKAKPSETLYIDYKQKNINVARKMGMQILLYKNNNQLKKELMRKLK